MESYTRQICIQLLSSVKCNVNWNEFIKISNLTSTSGSVASQLNAHEQGELCRVFQWVNLIMQDSICMVKYGYTSLLSIH